MVDGAGSASPPRFAAAGEFLRGLDPEDLGSLLASAADVAFVVDGDGVILDAAFSDADLAGVGGPKLGRPTADRHGDRRNPVEGRGPHPRLFASARRRGGDRSTTRPVAGRHSGALSSDSVRRTRPHPCRRTRSAADGGAPAAPRRSATGDGARIHPDSQCREAVPAALSARLGSRPDPRFEHGAHHRGQSGGLAAASARSRGSSSAAISRTCSPTGAVRRRAPSSRRRASRRASTGFMPNSPPTTAAS